MALDPITGGLVNTAIGVVGKVLDKIFPDKLAQAKERAEAEFALFQLQQSGELKQLEISMSAILEEAKSADPWTSRARPMFLYVIYFMLLMSVPMGFLSVYDPAIPARVAAGMKAWLDAIPEELYALFGAGYLGYSGLRSWDKKRGVSRRD